MSTYHQCLLLLILILPYVNLLILKAQFISLTQPTPLTSNAFILIPICFGNPSTTNQCLNLILDSNSHHITLLSSTLNAVTGINVNVPYITPTTKQTTLFVSYTAINSTIHYSDIIFSNSKYLPQYEILIINNLPFTMNDSLYSGFFGLGNYLITPYESILTKMKHHNITHSSSFGYSFTSPNEVSVYFDEDKFIKGKQYDYCYLGKYFGSFEANYFCITTEIRYDEVNDNGKETKKIMLDKIDLVLFSTKVHHMQMTTTGRKVFDVYIKHSQGKCKVVNGDDNVYHLEYLKCEEDVNVEEFPDVHIVFMNSSLVMTIKAKDVFDEYGKSRMYVKNHCNYWEVDMNVLKYYDMHVDYEKALIGFRKNGIFDNEGHYFTKDVMIIKIIFIVLITEMICGGVFIFCIWKLKY